MMHTVAAITAVAVAVGLQSHTQLQLQLSRPAQLRSLVTQHTELLATAVLYERV
jgi:hypothetical protein